MKVRGRFDLTYCSNIHAGETWRDVRSAIGQALPSIRTHLQADGPFAIGLRLSARAAAELAQPAALAEFRDFLRDGAYYVPTINGFPYGAFHGARVKEKVYLPDWRQDARVDYTNRLATLLATLIKDAAMTEGSVSTVPGAFKGHLQSEQSAAAPSGPGRDKDVRAIADRMLEHAAHLVRLRDDTGVTIALAVEPEPACFIETTAEAVDFFTRYLLDEAFVSAWSRGHGHSLDVDAVRRHIGVCFDACHMAVEFEDPAAALADLARAGIRVPKFQISSALRVTNPSARKAIERFADDTYLHQVVEKIGDRLTRYTDLPEALAGGTKVPPLQPKERAVEAGLQSRLSNVEWRVHFHVPVFLRTMGELETTQPELEALLDLLKARPEPACLEVETYTWDVLPPEFRNVDMNTAIARELAWTRDRLNA